MVTDLRISPAGLQQWLEWASARLLAMPSDKIKPREPRALWPEYSQDKFELIEFRSRISLRALAPSSHEIPVMDEILLLPNLCSNQVARRIIRLRSLVNPLNNHHLNRWAEISTKLSIKQYTATNLYKQGLCEITKRAKPQGVRNIRLFFEAAGVYIQ